MQVGLPEAAGSSGKVEDIVDTPLPKKDKPANDASATEQQLQQLKSQFDAAKAQHRLQLQERNRQIGRLQEDREKLKGLLKQAEGDVRSACSAFDSAFNSILPLAVVVLLTASQACCVNVLCQCRNAKASGLCTVCQQNTRNCLILPCLHYLLCAGCVQQHTSTCPFCPACQTKVSGLLVVLTTI